MCSKLCDEDRERLGRELFRIGRRLLEIGELLGADPGSAEARDREDVAELVGEGIARGLRPNAEDGEPR